LRDAGYELPYDNTPVDGPIRSQGRTVSLETPLMHLSRRKDAKGRPFLSKDQVQVGERLHEDFALALLDDTAPTDWDRYIQGDTIPVSTRGAAQSAHKRVAQALSDLGPGLGDVVLMCLCEQRGLEVAEKSLGWAARSGKIVLRIALLRLIRFYKNHGETVLIG
ncbi:MAG: DUF6456 domain-containing protein, partial [Pseudomonadota bacterium]